MPHEKNVPELLTDTVEHLSRLFRKEAQLARAEAHEKIQQLTIAIIYIAVGGVLGLAALIVLLFALAAFLVNLGVSAGLAFLIVGVLVGVTAGILMWKGMSDLKATDLIPRRTVEQLRADLRSAREQV